jgi:NAD(P)-dependent dehydrogenase (short-subunit alcohol dehydrogenase family)
MSADSQSRPEAAGTLRGATAVVTGGAGTGAGLGRGLVRCLAAQGMRVAILDVDLEAASTLAEELRLTGTDAIACRADVRDHDSLQQAAAQVQEVFGGCNILCAHVGGGGQGRFSDLAIDEWRDALEVMVLGTVATVYAFLPMLRATSGLRRIVLTSSLAALAPGRFQGPYRAAKAAVTSIGETIDLELGPEGIGATIVFPAGMLPAELMDLARSAMGQPLPAVDDILSAVAQEMASDPADLATGEAAAGPVIEAILAGRRYVVTHGITSVASARARHVLLDEALAEPRLRRLAPPEGP